MKLNTGLGSAAIVFSPFILSVVALLAGFLSFLNLSWAENDISYQAWKNTLRQRPLKQVTTHLAADQFPAISGDGKWLAYSSNRESENFDVYIRSLQEERLHRVAFFPSPETAPAFSRKNHMLAFVSRSDDANGDIWIRKYPLLSVSAEAAAPYLKKITDYMGYDGEPCFASDGRTLAFVSTRTAGIKNIFLYHIKSKTITAVTEEGGFAPSFSPAGTLLAYIHPLKDGQTRIRLYNLSDKTTQTLNVPLAGIDLSLCWEDNGRKLIVSRIGMDTNGDTKINLKDNASLYVYSLQDQRMIQLTTDARMAYQPACAGLGDMIYFTSRQSRNSDVWAFSLKDGGEVPWAPQADYQYQYAMDLSADPHRDWQIQVLAFKRVYEFFPESEDFAALALLEIGKLYDVHGESRQAESIFQKIPEKYPFQIEIGMLAKLEMIHLKEKSLRVSVQRLEKKKQKEFYLEKCQPFLQSYQKVIENHKDVPQAVAMAYLYIGQIYSYLGRHTEAFEAFDHILKEFPGLPDLCARAQIYLTDTYYRLGVGRKEDIIKSYLTTLDRYPHEIFWCDTARTRILLIYDQGESEKERIAGLNQLIRDYPQYPRLGAMAMYKIGKIFEDNQKRALAVSTYEQLAHQFSNEQEWLVRAKSTQARLEWEAGEDSKAIGILEILLERYSPNLDPFLLREIRENLEQYLNEKGRRALRLRDRELALKMFRKLILLNPSQPLGHRGLIDVFYTKGEIKRVIRDYEVQLRKKELPTAVSFYALGYAYTYLIQPRLKAKQKLKNLEIAKGYLEQCLSLEYDFLYAYLTLGWVNETLSDVLSDKDYNEEAIETSRMALSLNNEQSDPILEGLLCLNIANNFYRLDKFDKAIEYYRKKYAYSLRFENKAQEREVYKSMAHSYERLEEYDSALTYYQRALALAQEENNTLLELDLYQRLAKMYQEQNFFDQSSEQFQKAIQKEKVLGKPRYQHQFQEFIALNHLRLEEPEEAILYSARTEEYFRTHAQLTRGYQKKKSRLEIALFNQPIIKIPMKEAWTKFGSSDAEEGFQPIDLRALNFTILGQSHLLMQDYEKAIQSFREKLTLAYKKESAPTIARCLNNIGFFFYHLAEYDSALAYFQNSLNLCLDPENRFWEGAYSNQRNIYYVRILQLQKEEIRKEEIPKLILKLKAILNSPLSQTDVQSLTFYNYLGILYAQWGEKLEATGVSGSEKWIALIKDQNEPLFEIGHRCGLNPSEICYFIASTYFEKALTLAQRLALDYEQAVLLKNLGEMTFRLGYRAQAGEFLDRALYLSESYNFSDLRWRILHSLGCIYEPDEKEGRSEEGRLKYFRHAVDILEQLPLKTAGLRHSSLEERNELYRHTIEEMIRFKEYPQGWSYLERLKAKRYTDLLSAKELVTKRERHKIFYGNIRFLQEQIFRLKNDLYLSESGKKTLRDSVLENKADTLETYETEYRETIEEMNEEEPELTTLVTSTAVSLNALQGVLREGATALQFFITENKIYLFVIQSQHLHCFETDYRQKNLIEQVRRFRSLAENPLADLETLKREADELGTLLLGPARRLFEESEELIVIPDGILFYLPFAALRLDGDYLAQAHTLVFSPSASYYYYCYERRNVNTSTTAAFLQQQGGWEETILQKFCENPTLFSGKSCSRKTFETQAGEFGFVHLNIPFILTPQNPLQSRLFFEHFSVVDSQTLKVFEIYAFDLKANLIILSGLQSPIPANGSAEALVLLARALGYAGTPSLCWSLWPVEEKYRLEFFNDFYLYLSKLTDDPKMTKSSALSNGVVHLLEKYPHPYYWAGYQLIGFGGMNKNERQDFAKQHLDQMMRKGLKAEKAEEWKDATRFYEAALTMEKELKETKHLNVIYNKMVNAYMQAGQYERAVEIQNILLVKAREENNSKEIAHAYQVIRYCYQQAGQWEKAIVCENQYLALCRTLGLKKGEAQSLFNIATLYDFASHFDTAVVYYLKAKGLYRKLDETESVIQMLREVSRIYLNSLDDYNAALDYEKEALKVNEEELGDEVLTGKIYQRLGLILLKRGEYGDALEHQEKALAIFQKAGESTESARCQQTLADIAWVTGDFQNAFRYQKKAIEQFEKLDQPGLLVSAYSTYGLIYLSVGDFSKAFEMENRGIQLAQELGQETDIATLYNNLGLIYRSQGQYSQALEYFLKALEIDQRLNSQWGMAYDYRNLATCYQALEQLDLALENVQKSLSLCRQIQDKTNIAKSTYSIGEIYFLKKQFTEARQYLKQALEQALQMGLQDLQWRAYRKLGQIHQNLGEASQALVQYESAIAVIEAMRAKLNVEKFKTGFFDDKLNVYEDLIGLLLSLHRVEEAFLYVERSKARNFLDLIGNQKIDFSKGKNPEYQKKENQFRTKMERITRSLAEVQAQPGLSAEQKKAQLAVLNDSLQQVRESYQELSENLQAENPEMASLINVAPLSLAELQNLLDSKSAVLEYYGTGSHILLWIITKEKIYYEMIPLPNQELIIQVKAFREQIQNLVPLEQSAQTLYRLLISPAERYFQGVTHLCIVPHGIMHYLPFAALLADDKKYLLEKYTISYAPSASVAGFCLKKKPVANKRVIAFGNPDLGDPNLDLPFAEREARSLQRTFEDFRLFLRREATETTVKDSVSKAGFLHFACHGEFEEQNPVFSCLRMSADNQNDGRLEVHEIFGLKLNANLVTLSACETGLGKITSGDDVVGLTRSFLYAGTPSVIASLWRVDDVATSVMIKRFYRNIETGGKANALRDAQLLVKAQVNEHPAYWAAFGLTGDYR